MKVYVKVKAGSSKEEIESFGEGRYLVYLKARAENNEANIALIKMLSKYLCVPSGRIKIKAGLTNNEKILEVM